MEIVLDYCFKFIIIYNICKFNKKHILQIISHKCKNNFNEKFTYGSLRTDLYDEERESDKGNLDLCTIVDQLSLDKP